MFTESPLNQLRSSLKHGSAANTCLGAACLGALYLWTLALTVGVPALHIFVGWTNLGDRCTGRLAECLIVLGITRAVAGVATLAYDDADTARDEDAENPQGLEALPRWVQNLVSYLRRQSRLSLFLTPLPRTCCAASTSSSSPRGSSWRRAPAPTTSARRCSSTGAFTTWWWRCRSKVLFSASCTGTCCCCCRYITATHFPSRYFVCVGVDEDPALGPPGPSEAARGEGDQTQLRL